MLFRSKVQIIECRSAGVFLFDGQHLITGKPFEEFEGLRSRELLGNWLCCVAINSITQADRLTFSSDPTGSDGIIIDTTTGETWPGRHRSMIGLDETSRAFQYVYNQRQSTVSSAALLRAREGRHVSYRSRRSTAH